jgi:alpha 1,3-glucosidase
MVKVADFKTCGQSGFCTRQRAFTPSDSPYKLALPLLITNNSLSAKIERSGIFVVFYMSGVAFNLAISLHTESILHITLVESDPIHLRYTVPADQLPPPLDAMSWSEKEGNLIWAGHELEIQADPFKLVLKRGEEAVMEFNGKGLFNYEHYRQRPPVKSVKEIVDKDDDLEDEAVEEKEGEKEEEKLVLETADAKLTQGEWEEDFKGSKDTKPFGIPLLSSYSISGPASIGIDISFPGSRNLYGIPQHASSFRLHPTRGDGAKYSEPYRLYNADVFEYILDSPMALYGHVPYIWSHTREGLEVGVLWMNHAEQWVDVREDDGSSLVHWSAESGILDLYVMVADSPKGLSSLLAKVTGKPAMPQAFAIAYHQCRWNYNDEADVKGVSAGLDEWDIPADVVWLDIEHTDGKRYFTWDEKKFPDPVGMQNELAVVGRRVWISINHLHFRW